MPRYPSIIETDRDRLIFDIGFEYGKRGSRIANIDPSYEKLMFGKVSRKPKRKLSDWQKFIKANSKKKKFKFANGKLKLKSMGIAYRKTAAYKRNKKK